MDRQGVLTAKRPRYPLDEHVRRERQARPPAERVWWRSLGVAWAAVALGCVALILVVVALRYAGLPVG